MDIRYDGGIIVYESGEFEKMSELRCVCGHTVWEHGSPVYFHYPSPNHHTVYTSQCVMCGFKKGKKEFGCSQFKLEK